MKAVPMRLTIRVTMVRRMILLALLRHPSLKASARWGEILGIIIARIARHYLVIGIEVVPHLLVHQSLERRQILARHAKHKLDPQSSTS